MNDDVDIIDVGDERLEDDERPEEDDPPPVITVPMATAPIVVVQQPVVDEKGWFRSNPIAGAVVIVFFVVVSQFWFTTIKYAFEGDGRLGFTSLLLITIFVSILFFATLTAFNISMTGVI